MTAREKDKNGALGQVSEKEETSKGLGSRILGTDRRIISSIALLAMIWPLAFPIGLPIVNNKYTIATYNFINKFPEGSIAFVEANFDTGYLGSIQPSMTSLLTHLVRNNWKIVAYSIHSEGPMVWSISWNLVDAALRNKYKYGVDYAFLGYIAGGETAQIKAGQSLRSLFSFDYYGTPLNQIPILKNIDSAKDYNIVVSAWRDGAIGQSTLRVWSETYKVPLIQAGQMAEPPVAYLDAGLLAGYVRGQRGAAEYELLLGKPGLAVALMDATSFFWVVLLSSVVVGNVGFVLRRKEGK